jgi:4-hydroxybenzoyl-CoA reductase subunit beta
VATASKRCVAMSSTDCAPALLVLSTKVRLVSAQGERELALEKLYNNDGIDYLRRRPDEVLSQVRFENLPSTYWKLRRRGAFDFPVLGVAAAMGPEGARIALGAVASRPFLVDSANEFLRAKRLSDDVIEEAGRMVASRAKPMDNADLDLYWRKDVTAAFVGYALRELRGDDMRETRLRIARYQPA